MPRPTGEPLHPVEASRLHARRERVFLVLAGIFLGSMAMLNILGITKFIRLGDLSLGGHDVLLAVAVGVLPYPLTFLCTDFISELYGRARANAVVLTGLLVNLVVLGFIWIGDAAPATDFRSPVQRIVTMDYLDAAEPAATDAGAAARGRSLLSPEAEGPSWARPAVPRLDVEGRPVTGPDGRPELRPVERFEFVPIPGGPDGAVQLVDADTGQPVVREETLFSRIATTTRQAMIASMIAYLLAQLVDVHLFHFWKRITRGRMLWVRNNGSTLVSQLVDTTAVVLITFWGLIVAGDMPPAQVLALIGSGYLFKVIVALVDTIPFYLGVAWLSRYLELDPRQEHRADAEEVLLHEPTPAGPSVPGR